MRKHEKRVLNWSVGGGDAMDDITGKIEELEVKAAESALIAYLTPDWEIRTYNSRLARDLLEAAADLRRRAEALKSDNSDIRPL